jgi:hypothetical protein
MNSYSVDSDEAMKQGDDAINASSLQFFRSFKHFIATNFYFVFNTSPPLLRSKESSFNALSPLKLQIFIG